MTRITLLLALVGVAAADYACPDGECPAEVDEHSALLQHRAASTMATEVMTIPNVTCESNGNVACPGSGTMCMGDQCCPGVPASGGGTFPCPSASDSYKSCVNDTKLATCGTVTTTTAPVAESLPSLAAGVQGFMYTSLNGEGENEVVSFARGKDGSILYQREFKTGALGGSNRSTGGIALGDFDGQGGVQIIEDSLLVVNAGGNSVSVFALCRLTGTLSLKGVYSSQGVRPVSLAVQPTGEPGRYWVAVGNQWGNPNVQLGGPNETALQFFPDREFIETGRLELNQDRNVFLFSFDAETRVLTPQARIDEFVGTYGGPTCVSFSPDGSKLAVATWGIAHLTSGFPGQFQQPSRVYVYDFNSTSGNATNARFFEETGVAGSIGFRWNPVSGRDLLYVSNFNLAEDKLDYGVTVLEATSQSVVSVQNFRTGEPGGPVEDCWTAISRDGNVLWVSAFGTNIISSFQISQVDGYLSAVGGGNTTEFVSRPTAPVGDTKDLWPSPDGKWLYNLGAFESFKAVEFAVNATSLSLVEEVPVWAATPRARGAFNFLGLTGFDFA